MSDDRTLSLVVHSGGCPICGFRNGAHAVSCPSNPNNQVSTVVETTGEVVGESPTICMTCNYDYGNHHPACPNASPAE